MYSGANDVSDGTVRGTRIPRWASSQLYFVEPFLVVTQEVLPSILPLENGIMCTASSILIAEQRSCRSILGQPVISTGTSRTPALVTVRVCVASVK